MPLVSGTVPNPTYYKSKDVLEACPSPFSLLNPLTPQICNSSYCQPYNSYDVSSENLVLDQLIIPKLIFFFVLITSLVDIVEIL